MSALLSNIRRCVSLNNVGVVQAAMYHAKVTLLFIIVQEYSLATKRRNKLKVYYARSLFLESQLISVLLSYSSILNDIPTRSQMKSCIINSYLLQVIDHYENPRNVGSMDKKDKSVGTGLVGAPACGDVMKLQIKVDENGKIIDAKFKTFGCGSAIASSSLATEWVKGKTVDEALTIKNTDIAKELSLPPVKLHCSSKCYKKNMANINNNNI